MGTILKVILFTSPVWFLLLYYIISQQNRIDVQLQKEDAAFEREWNEFNRDLTKDPVQKKEYADRAERAEQKRQEIEKREREKEEKAERLEREMQKTMEDEETQKSLEKRLKSLQ
jgi:biopolymer transport protein ExbB/TolQ